MEDWVVLERERRQQVCLDALETLAALDVEAGTAGRSAGWLRACVGIDPLRETAQRALMAALAHVGDYAGSVQVYRAFRLLLREELNTRPAAETIALYEQIKRQAHSAAAKGVPDVGRTVLLPVLPDDAARFRAAEIEGSRQLSKDSAETPELALVRVRSVPSPPTNLPQQSTSFIGREKERAEVRALLAKSRLLTLTGAGGCGKTRLALQVAAEMREFYPDGTWLVEFAPLNDPALVTQTVAQALDVKEQAGQPLQQTLAEGLKNRCLLLVLDNCEHLLAGCATLAAAIVRNCPMVQVLVTSRTVLGISGEQSYRVPSLRVPDQTLPCSLETVVRYEAVRLFVDRALLVKSDFAVSPRNAPALSQVCRRLDGIPLAIELAAARVRSLAVEDINRRLDDRFRLLIGGDREALPRHQTLRAAIDWSYDLLNAREQLLLSRLSVFAGGWTLAAAEQICSDMELRLSSIESQDLLDLLTDLVDKSLVLAEEHPETTRYRLLETVRQYAAERLQEGGEMAQIKTRHRDWFMALAEEAEAQLTGPEQSLWLQRLTTEHDNLRTALATCETDVESAEAGVRFTGALWRFWQMRGYLMEGREHLGRALGRKEAQARTKSRAKVLNGAGALAQIQGDYAASRPLHTEGLDIFRELGDTWGIAWSLNLLGLVTHEQCDYAAAQALHEESLALRRELGDKRGIANSLNNLGNVAFSQGDYERAHVLHAKSLELKTELGDRGGIANSLSNLGLVAYFENDYPTARSLFEESRALYIEIGDRRGSAKTLGNLGQVALHEGDNAIARTLYEGSVTIFRDLGDRRGVTEGLEELAVAILALGEVPLAVRLWSATHALRESLGARLSPMERERFDQSVLKARAILGEEAFASAWNEGRALSWEQAVACALSQRPH